jgi:hypothetical protein
MGNSKKARLDLDGKTYEGEAQLESSELLFHGDRRVIIAFQQIASVTAVDGELRIRYAGRDAVLHLGSDAPKWAEKILHPKTVVQKLGIRPGQHVSVVHLDDESFITNLHAAGAMATKGKPKSGSDAIFYGASTRADLARLSTLKSSLADNGALWIIRPKGVKEITEDDVMAAGKAAGLVDVKVVRFSDTHTAEKFVVPVAQRAPRKA